MSVISTLIYVVFFAIGPGMMMINIIIELTILLTLLYLLYL